MLRVKLVKIEFCNVCFAVDQSNIVLLDTHDRLLGLGLLSDDLHVVLIDWLGNLTLVLSNHVLN